MDRLERDLRRELDRLGLPSGSELARAWPEVVGEAIARNAWPARLARNGTLHVNTSSATWAFELKHLAPKILSRFRERLGDCSPKELRFAPGPLPESGPALAPPPRPREIADADRLAASQAAAAIEDEGLRLLVARAAAASLARSSSER